MDAGPGDWLRLLERRHPVRPYDSWVPDLSNRVPCWWIGTAAAYPSEMRSLQPVAPSASILAGAIHDRHVVLPSFPFPRFSSSRCRARVGAVPGREQHRRLVRSVEQSVGVVACRTARRPATSPQPRQQSPRTATRSGRYRTETVCRVGSNSRARTLRSRIGRPLKKPFSTTSLGMKTVAYPLS